MPRSCLIVLHLDAVPGIGAQGIIGTEDGIDGATGIPEVDIQSMSTGIVVHLPDVAPVAVAGNRQLSAISHITAETEVETGEGLCLWAGGQGRVDIGVLATGVVERQGIRTAVDHCALHGCTPRTIAAWQGPGVKIATLKPITEVGRGGYARPAEGHGLWTIGRIVSQNQASAARSCGARSESDGDSAGAASCQGVGASWAGVGLRKVSRIRSGQRNAADAQRRRAAVSERDSLRSTVDSNLLVAKVHTCRIQADYRCCEYPCSTESHRLGTASRVISEGEVSAASATCARGEGQTDRAGAASCQRVAAAGTGVALGKVSRIRSGQRNAVDA